MTPQEIVDNINGPTSDNKNFYALMELLDENKSEEAILYIQSNFQCDNETANNALILYKEQAYNEIIRIRKKYAPTPEQIALANAEARALQNKPTCPTCGSTNVKKISATARAAGAITFGWFSPTARSQFKCSNCGYKW